MPGDAQLAQVCPPAFWGHGGLDPLFDEERETLVRDFMREHTDMTEVRREMLGHGIDEAELAQIASFVQLRWDEHAAS